MSEPRPLQCILWEAIDKSSSTSTQTHLILVEMGVKTVIAENMSRWVDDVQTFNMMSISSLKELKEIIDAELANRHQGFYNDSQQKTSKLEVVK